MPGKAQGCTELGLPGEMGTDVQHPARDVSPLLPLQWLTGTWHRRERALGRQTAVLGWNESSSEAALSTGVTYIYPSACLKHPLKGKL